MRRLLAVAAAAVAAAVTVAGCGSEDLEPVSIAEAADRTRAAETARFEMELRVEGMGLPRAMTFDAEGVTATAAPRMDMTMDFGAVLALAGTSGGEGRLRLLLDGSRLWVDPPEVDDLVIPGGARWATVDVSAVVRAIGVDPGGLGPYMRISLEQQLDALKAAGAVEEAGTEEIDGVETRRFRGRVSTRDHLEVLPADERERAEQSIRDFERWARSGTSLDDETPLALWVDGEGRVRRMRQEIPVPAQQGVAAGEVTMTMDLGDFGAELDVQAPPAGDTWDGTRELARALRAAG